MFVLLTASEQMLSILLNFTIHLSNMTSETPQSAPGGFSKVICGKCSYRIQYFFYDFSLFRLIRLREWFSKMIR